MSKLTFTLTFTKEELALVRQALAGLVQTKTHQATVARGYNAVEYTQGYEKDARVAADLHARLCEVL